jgi:hypothetical protein
VALTGTVQPAAAHAMGFDIATELTGEEAKAYRADGYTFCIRYVSRDAESRPGNQDLSSAEAQSILDAGLALMVVQRVAGTGWVPCAGLGQEYGQNAAQYTGEADIPPGVNLWLDLENVPQNTPWQDIVAYCNNWFEEVSQAGYVPGVYVGSNCGLTGDQLYYELTTQHYWRSASVVPDVTRRSYQLVQQLYSPEIDRDFANPDKLGGTAWWLAPA